MSAGVYEVTMTAIEAQGVPGEPDGGVWTLKFAANDETGATDAARRTCPGWTVVKVEPEPDDE